MSLEDFFLIESHMRKHSIVSRTSVAVSNFGNLVVGKRERASLLPNYRQ